MYPHTSPPFVTIGIAGIAFGLVVLFVLAHRAAARTLGLTGEGVRRWTALAAGGAALWVLAFGAAAASGMLARFDARPPPLALMLVAAIAGAFGFARSRAGAALANGLPLAALIGFQAFRLPLELVMHGAARAGVMPPQMSYSGWNFDVVTGASAIIVALLVAKGRAPRALVLAWNVMGLVLVTVVMTIGVVSTPMIRAFGDDAQNTWIAYVPFVWLPAVMVVAAYVGHLLVFRKLALAPRTPIAATT